MQDAFVDIAYNLMYNHVGLPLTRRLFTSLEGEVVLMQYVTYENLYEFIMILVAIVTLCYTVFKHKK